MKTNETRKITVTAMLIAFAAVLKIISFSYSIGGGVITGRISFFAIPLMLAGYMFGPGYGLLAGFATDTVYILTNPFATSWSVFTVSTMIWGISGYLLRKLRYKHFTMSLILIILITSLFETAINTLGMYLLDPSGGIAIVSLFMRIITQIIRLPLLVIVMRALVKSLENQMIEYFIVE